jgi:hypothetical protein
MVEAKARKRMSGPAPDYPTLRDFSKPVAEIIVANRITGMTVFLQLYPSRRRSDAFAVTRDGQPWKQCIGSARLGRGIGKSLALNFK